MKWQRSRSVEWRLCFQYIASSQHKMAAVYTTFLVISSQPSPPSQDVSVTFHADSFRIFSQCTVWWMLKKIRSVLLLPTWHPAFGLWTRQHRGCHQRAVSSQKQLSCTWNSDLFDKQYYVCALYRFEISEVQCNWLEWDTLEAMQITAAILEGFWFLWSGFQKISMTYHKNLIA